METITDNKAARFDVEQKVHVEDHRVKERRQEESEGYTYISMVGWICRRERFRRKDLARPQ